MMEIGIDDFQVHLLGSPSEISDRKLSGLDGKNYKNSIHIVELHNLKRPWRTGQRWFRIASEEVGDSSVDLKRRASVDEKPPRVQEINYVQRSDTSVDIIDKCLLIISIYYQWYQLKSLDFELFDKVPKNIGIRVPRQIFILFPMI